MSGTQESTPSLSTLITTLVPVVAIAACGFTAFLLLRGRYKRIYQPRSFLSTLRPQERTPMIEGGLFGWISEYFKIPDTYVLNHQSIDAYFLLRFLRMGALICLVGACITFPILWPVYATASGTATQLQKISLSNVVTYNDPRLYATVFVAWAFFGFCWFLIARESIYYINVRQAYLLSPLYAHRMSSRTVLYNSVPLDYCNESIIRRLFKETPPVNVWVATDCKDLRKMVDEREKDALKLEGAEVNLIKTANDNRLKALKKDPSRVEEEHAIAAADIEGESGSAAGRWVEPKKRPTHRLKPLIGKKVDTINWCREEIARLTPLIERSQAEHRAGDVKPVGSVFVEFGTQAEAQAAYQSTTHHQALHMEPRFIGTNPDEIIWTNLRIKWWERLLRKFGTTTFCVLLLVFWAIPLAFVGIISNLYNVLPSSCYPGGSGPTYMAWLCFITKLPSVLFGLIQGLLPAILISVLMALVPIVLRLMAKWGGAPTKASVELSVQSWYFAFQVIEVFLVTTLGSTASAVATQIGSQPGSTPNLLATHIPAAANIYICYIIVQSLGFFWGSLLQIVGLILFKVLGMILDKTPRKMYNRWMSLSGLGWGTVFPVYELFVVICIIYSCISPLILGWSAIGLYLVYHAFRYNLIFVYNANIDTKGLVYPTALNHLTVGLYIAEICYIGIFAIKEAPGPIVLMVVFTIATILFHMALNRALRPLLYTLPTSLNVEEARLQELEDGYVNRSNGATNGTNVTSKGAMGPANDVVAESDVAAAADGKPMVEGTHELMHSTTLPPPHAKPNFIVKWLRPDKYADYETMRRLVPRNFADISYPEEVERDAYYDPAITAVPPTLWVPRDPMGVSRQEVAHTGKVIEISDEDAVFDEKGKIVWDQDVLPPIYREKIYY